MINMIEEKKETKINISNYDPKIISILFRIAVVLVIPISITFFVRTWYTEIPILRFNVTGAIIVSISLFNAIFTIYIYRIKDEKSRNRMQLILTLISDILLITGGLAAATIYVGPM